MSGQAKESVPASGLPREGSDSLQMLLEQRFSCRGFLPRPVPRETIRHIAALAQRTASWCNSQPWQVTIVGGEALRRLGAQLYSHAQQHPADPDFPFPAEYRGVYLERRRACGLALYASVGVEKGDRAASAIQALENYRFFGAPHVAFVTTDSALGVYGAIDCGAYVSNFMLAATSVGVAAIAQAALAAYPALLRAQLGLAEDRRVICGISFGYEDRQHPANGFRTGRAKVDDVLNWIE